MPVPGILHAPHCFPGEIEAIWEQVSVTSRLPLILPFPFCGKNRLPVLQEVVWQRGRGAACSLWCPRSGSEEDQRTCTAAAPGTSLGHIPWVHLSGTSLGHIPWAHPSGTLPLSAPAVPGPRDPVRSHLPPGAPRAPHHHRETPGVRSGDKTLIASPVARLHEALDSLFQGRAFRKNEERLNTFLWCSVRRTCKFQGRALPGMVLSAWKNIPFLKCPSPQQTWRTPGDLREVH